MKKIFTLIIACLAVTFTSFAQTNDNPTDQGRGYRNNNSGNNNGRYGNGGYNNNNDTRYYNFRTEADLLRDMDLSRQQERRIMRINEEYRDKVSRIQNNRWVSGQQKRYQLERLEQQRRQEIMNVLSRYQRDRYSTWCSRNNNNNTYGNGGYNNGRW